MKPSWDDRSEDDIRPGALDAQPERECDDPDCPEHRNAKVRVMIEIDVPVAAITDEPERFHGEELAYLAGRRIASEPDAWLRDAYWTVEYLK